MRIADIIVALPTQSQMQKTKTILVDIGMKVIYNSDLPCVMRNGIQGTGSDMVIWLGEWRITGQGARSRRLTI